MGRLSWYSAVFVMLSLGAGCSKPGDSPPDPLSQTQGQMPEAWLDTLIDQILSEPVRNPPAYVARYAYQGETVYYVPPYCCDKMGRLYDSSGTVLCNPDGGFTGNGDGRCPDFVETRENGEILWRDPRGSE